MRIGTAGVALAALLPLGLIACASRPVDGRDELNTERLRESFLTAMMRSGSATWTLLGRLPMPTLRASAAATSTSTQMGRPSTSRLRNRSWWAWTSPPSLRSAT